MIFQLIEFLSCFSTFMSTLYDGPLVRQNWTIQGWKFRSANLPGYLSWVR